MAAKKYRRTAGLNTVVEMFDPPVHETPWPKAVVHYHFFLPNKRRRDIGNLEASMKSALDGIVDSGLIEDDNYEVLIHAPSSVDIDRANPRVEITVTRVDT